MHSSTVGRAVRTFVAVVATAGAVGLAAACEDAPREEPGTEQEQDGGDDESDRDGNDGNDNDDNDNDDNDGGNGNNDDDGGEDGGNEDGGDDN